ncbi:MAG: sensor histidine kinase, partial [Burkholderiaceae bacterium]
MAFTRLLDWRLVAVLAGLVCFAGSPLPSAAETTSARQPRPFTEALAADDDGQGRFPIEALQRVVALPDEWEQSRPNDSSPRWYRLRFDVDTAAGATGLLGLYIERACANVQVQLNGQRLHAAGRTRDPIALDCQRPLLLPLPPSMLQAGANTLDLRLAGYALQQVASSERAGGLSAPLVGEYAALHARHAKDTLLAVTLPMAASALLVLTGLTALAIGRTRRRDVHLRFFGAMAFGWAIVTARLWWHDLPLANFHTELLLASLPPLLALVTVQFLMHYAGWRSRPIEVALTAQCLAVPASLLLAGPLRVHMIASSWYALLVLQVLGAIAFYLWSTWRARRRDFWTMAWLLGAAAALVVLELAAQQEMLPAPWHHLSHNAMPLVFVALGLHLLAQYGRALQTAEDSRQALEVRVREASADMERNFAQLAEQRVEQVTQQERKRIAADLHDDLGAKLLTIVHTSESERISTLA